MIVLHGSTPLELLKAVMLCKIYKCSALPANTVFDLLYTGETLNTVDLSEHQVALSYEKKFGTIQWLGTKKLKNLLAVANYAIRYKADNRFRVVLAAFSQALENGPDYVISRVSREARLMYDRARQVSTEIHRAYGFVRLNPVISDTGEIMVGKIEFQNDICDIVLRYFSRRLKYKPVYLIENENAYHLENGYIAITPVRELPFIIPANDFNSMWEAYYDSQFIEERKNPALARKHLPKKYWSWVPEGKKLT